MINLDCSRRCLTFGALQFHTPFFITSNRAPFHLAWPGGRSLTFVPVIAIGVSPFAEDCRAYSYDRCSFFNGRFQIATHPHR